MQTPPADCAPGGFYRSPKGLQNSRWAKATTPTPSYTRRPYASTAINPAVPIPPPAPGADAPLATRHSYELQRFEKIAKRLSWKLFHLSAGFHRTSAADPSERPQCEIMFKLDFYEFYMLLERALVHLLGVFDISVSRDADPSAGLKGPGGGGGRRDADHAYHHNVLAALDSPDNVLHGVLGRGDVRACLGKAKDMRNRWKYLDEQQSGGELGLEECNVEAILETIVGAFEAAYEVARSRVESESETVGEPEQQVDWGFMVDAMDWEAL